MVLVKVGCATKAAIGSGGIPRRKERKLDPAFRPGRYRILRLLGTEKLLDT